ncbi:MAG TPA: hypothetical protein VHO27_02870, partial [Angustibacter sp.]|nr:hypothetical protein [Angustibacter sp.]
MRRRPLTLAALATALLASALVVVPGNARAAGTSSADPSAITGLLSRWRATDLGLGDGQRVASWADPVGGVTLTAPTTARQPAFRASATELNGAAAIDFSSSSLQSLIASTATGDLPGGYLAGVTGASVFVVMSTPAKSSTAAMFFASTGSSATSARVLENVTAAGDAAIGVRRRDTDAFKNVYSSASALPAAAASVVAGVVDYAGGRATQYVNGTQAATATLASKGTSDATGSLKVAVGVNGSDATALEGSIAEILVFAKPLDASERAVVDTYVQDTYGIATADYAGDPATSGPTATTSTTDPTTSTTTSTTTAPTTSTTTSTTTDPTTSTTTSTTTAPTTPTTSTTSTTTAPTTTTAATTTTATTTATTATSTTTASSSTTSATSSSTSSATSSASDGGVGSTVPSTTLVSRWRAADLGLADGASVPAWVDPVSGVGLAQGVASRQP